MKLKNDIDSGQRLADDDEGKLWHVYDLVGAYALRGRVQQAFDKVVETYGPTRIALLEAVDTLFVSFTEVDSRHVARDAERRGFVPRSGAWWWDRLPTSGPVAEHARTFPDGGFILEDLEGPEGDGRPERANCPPGTRTPAPPLHRKPAETSAGVGRKGGGGGWRTPSAGDNPGGDPERR